MYFADITDDRHFHSMSYQQLNIVTTLPMPTTDNIYQQCTLQFSQLAANGSTANNVVCNQSEVDVILLFTITSAFVFLILFRILYDTVFIR